MKKKIMLMLCVMAFAIMCTISAFAEGIIIIGIDETTTSAQTGIRDGNHTPAGMHIGSVDVGGMTREQVSDAIDKLVEELKGKNITIASRNGSTEIALADMDITCINKDELLVSVMGETGFGNLIQQYKQEKDVANKGLYFTPEYSVDSASLVNYLLTQNPELETSPSSASIVKDANGNFVVNPSQPGFAVDYDGTYMAVVEAIKNYDGQELETVEIVGSDISAAYDDSIYEGFGDLLGTSTTHYECTGKERTVNRATNIRVASSKINGTVLLPGQEFSFCVAVSPFTEEEGYRKAGTIMNGETVDDLGGGVCQVSTTLYGAVLYSELDVTFRKPHSKISSYVDPGLDAMVYVKHGQDFKFVNSTSHVIYIEAYTTPNFQGNPNEESVTFNIYGTEYRPAERSIWYEGVVISKEWLEGDLGSYTLEVDDTLDPAGNTYGGKRMMDIKQYPSPKVSAKALKHVYVNGVEASVEELPGSKVTYRGNLGIAAFHSNSYVRKIAFDPDTQIITAIEVVTKAEAGKPSPTKPSATDKPTTESTTEDSTTVEPTTVAPTTETIPPTEPPTEPPVTETQPPVVETVPTDTVPVEIPEVPTDAPVDQPVPEF